MPRQIKRYGSRKLYDTVESRYVSMQELAELIHQGEHVEVVDNKTNEDVTVQILTQVISEQGRRGSFFPSGLLHDLIKAGENALQAGEGAVTSGVKHLQQNVEGFVEKAKRDAFGRLRQPSPMQEEMTRLHERLAALENTLSRSSDASDATPTPD